MPRKKRAIQSKVKVGARLATRPKTAVKNSVRLNAVLLPSKSEPESMQCLSVPKGSKNCQYDAHDPQPIAPIIMPANMKEERYPI